jgi:hypothetical protein
VVNAPDVRAAFAALDALDDLDTLVALDVLEEIASSLDSDDRLGSLLIVLMAAFLGFAAVGSSTLTFFPNGFVYAIWVFCLACAAASLLGLGPPADEGVRSGDALLFIGVTVCWLLGVPDGKLLAASSHLPLGRVSRTIKLISYH